MTALPYPKRLIEVDLPIREISVHARREKSIRHGHISTLHIWWARRPLAACRAVLCASLWPDPADEHCPQSFRDAAATALCDFAEKVRTEKHLMELCAAHWTRWRSTDSNRFRENDPAAWLDIRGALLDFIADFANWDASSVAPFLSLARTLTSAAHAALGGSAGSGPVVLDPFAGGGSIPLEALRIGAEAVASDLNPVAVLLEKVALEYVPRFGGKLAAELESQSAWVREQLIQAMRRFYPARAGAESVAYIWARTVRCEGPGCGVDVPLIRSLWLARKARRSVALRLVPGPSGIEVNIVEGRAASTTGSATVRRGSAICPRCGFTTTVDRTRSQLRQRHFGTADARLLCVVRKTAGVSDVVYELPCDEDISAALAARTELTRREQVRDQGALPGPHEPFPQGDSRAFTPGIYGAATWGDLFAPRQQLLLSTLADLIQKVPDRVPGDLGVAVATALSMALGKLADFQSSLCTWRTTRTCVRNTFGRGAIPITWDFAEMNPFAGSAGDWDEACRYIGRFVAHLASALPRSGSAIRASATAIPLADDSVNLLCTDPPYYDAVPYAGLADFFYVWHRRAIGLLHPSLFSEELSPKNDECIVHPAAGKDRKFFEDTMRAALAEGRRVVSPDGIGIVVFAHKSTSGWEAQLQAMLDAGWIITASWPVDTERPGRLRANDSAALASSIHIVCRPRENHGAPLGDDELGSWRSVLTELPKRIHEWMPRLATEGVVGADAIFACLGPALEVFSRYSRVEKASGTAVTLREYLEHVWAAVSKEALLMIFAGADATGLEEDARLTAMWLWTLSTGASVGSGAPDTDSEEDAEDGDGEELGEESGSKGKGLSGFVLEFDAARKIAQGLGAHLEQLANVVEVKGDKARLLPVSERAKHLFAKDDQDEKPTADTKAKGKKKQLGLFAESEAAEKDGLLGQAGVPKVGETTLDRVHQAMILFGAGRSDALKRFVVEEGVGKDGRFWSLADSLSKLYPATAAEKRWVDGVLARKKSLGF